MVKRTAEDIRRLEFYLCDMRECLKNRGRSSDSSEILLNEIKEDMLELQIEWAPLKHPIYWWRLKRALWSFEKLIEYRKGQNG